MRSGERSVGGERHDRARPGGGAGTPEPAPGLPTSDTLEVAGVAVTQLPQAARAELVDNQMAVASARSSLTRFGLLAVAYCGVGTLALVVGGPVIWVAFWIIATSVLISLSFAEHEAIHGSLFDARVANDLAGQVCGALTMIPFAGYRTYHLQHHRRTHADGDAEPVTVIRTRLELVLVMPVVMIGFCATLWGQLIRSTLGRPVSWAVRTRRPGLDLGSIAAALCFAGLLVGLAVALGPLSVVGLWGVPLLASLAVGGLFAVPEHYEAEYGPGSLYDTSRTIYSNRLARWVLWNANYHTAHHLVPAVPGRNLAALQQLIDADCTLTERSYWSYHSGLWRRIGRKELPAEPPWRTSAVLDTGSDTTGPEAA